MSEDLVTEAMMMDDVQLLKVQIKESPSPSPLLHINGKSMLSLACSMCAYHCVQFLLSLPGINVNERDTDYWNIGSTPFMQAISQDDPSLFRMFLADDRVNTTAVDDRGRSGFWSCVRYYIKDKNNLKEYAELLIASGRDLGDLDKKAITLTYAGSIHDMRLKPNDPMRWGLPEDMKELLDQLVAHPSKLRYELRIKHGFSEQYITELFATVIFLCDDLLILLQQQPNLHATDSASTAAAASSSRFFLIMKRLPMELQMVLCHRVYQSSKDSIPSHKSEPAFQALAAAYQIRK